MIERDGIDFEICQSQLDIIERIRLILRQKGLIETIDGDQVFFKINCGELIFKVVIEKSILLTPKIDTPCSFYKKI